MQLKRLIRNFTLVAALAVFLAGGALYAQQDVKPFIGDWSGAITGGGMELALILHFELNDAGELTGTCDSPDQQAFGLALAEIKVEGKKISFTIDDPGVPGEPLFSGTLDEAGTTMEGDFSQGGGEGTFKMEKEK